MLSLILQQLFKRSVSGIGEKKANLKSVGLSFSCGKMLFTVSNTEGSIVIIVGQQQKPHSDWIWTVQP